MLKKKMFKKISLVVCCLLIIGIVMIFPSERNDITYRTDKELGVLYLLDDDDYLARVDYRYNSTDKNDLIKEMINVLTINKDNTIAIIKGFRAIIPEGTRLVSSSIEDDIAVLDFSSEILSVNGKYEEKMLEAIIYTLTSIPEINRVKILVDGKHLDLLPSSKKRIDDVLSRDFKINKEYDVDDMNNISSTTVYYLANKDDYIYYKPVTKYSNDSKEKIEIIIDELKSSSIYSTNLISFINEDTQLINYEILDKSLLLNFNDSILSDINSNNIIEEVTYAINMSIKENYNAESVSYYINDNIFDTYFLLLG